MAFNTAFNRPKRSRRKKATRRASPKRRKAVKRRSIRCGARRKHPCTPRQMAAYMRKRLRSRRSVKLGRSSKGSGVGSRLKALRSAGRDGIYVSLKDWEKPRAPIMVNPRRKKRKKSKRVAHRARPIRRRKHGGKKMARRTAKRTVRRNRRRSRRNPLFRLKSGKFSRRGRRRRRLHAWKGIQGWFAGTKRPRRKQRGKIRVGKGRRPSANRRRRARKNAWYNPFYTTAFNGRRKRRKVRRNGMSSGRARSLAMRRWYKNGNRKRRARRNPFSVGGIVGSLKSALSMRTVHEGAAVLAGAIAATGGVTLFPVAWRSALSGWADVGLKLLSASLAAIAASKFAPSYFTQVAAGGVVVVGLGLIQQFFPRALSWKGAVAGFLAPARGRVAGYLNPPAGAISVAPKRFSGGGLAGMRAGGENFKSPRF